MLGGRTLFFEKGRKRASVDSAGVDGCFINRAGIVVTECVGELDLVEDVIREGNWVGAHVYDEFIENGMGAQFAATVQ